MSELETTFEQAEREVRESERACRRRASLLRQEAEKLEKHADDLEYWRDELAEWDNPWAWPWSETVECVECDRDFDPDLSYLPLVCSVRDENICPRCALDTPSEQPQTDT